MKIFVSWSGDRSRAIGRALRDWLPLILHYAEPWLSDRDIDAGERWSIEVGKELESTHFGVVCLTQENISAPWLLFEAGALSKQLSVGAVVPYLFGIDFGTLSGPLAQFQAKKADRDGTRELVRSINSRHSVPVSDDRLNSLFDLTWPRFETLLQGIPSAPPDEHPERSTEEILEDLVATVRGFDRRLSSFTFEPTVASKTKPVVVDDGRTTMLLEMPTPNWPVGQSLSAGLGDNFLRRLAKATGLSIEGFCKDWFIRHKETGKMLTNVDVEHIAAFIRQHPGTLVLSDAPF